MTGVDARTPSRSAWSRLVGADRYLLAARLTLLATLVNGRDEMVVVLATAAVTTLIFLEPARLRSPLPWFALGAVLGWTQWVEWWAIDDHAVANTYWLFAIGLSRVARQPDRTLELSARLLLGGIFVVAIGWKLLSSQYVGAEFWRYTLLRDHRVEWVSEVAGGTSDATIDRNRADLAALTGSGEVDEVVLLAEGDRQAGVASFFTVWGVLIEAAIAIAFLAPLRGRWSLARPLSLFVFCCTTYVLIPVYGFAALLLTMGAVVFDDPRWRAATVPVAGVLLAWAGIFDLLV